VREPVGNEVEHGRRARGLDPADAGRHDHHGGTPERLGQGRLVSGPHVDHGDAVGTEAVERLAQQPLGRRLDHVDLAQDVVGRLLDPLGRAGLRVGIDERDGPA
jgi:hypothetical protein